MNLSLVKKAKIIISNSTKSIRRSIREVRSEFSLIVKNNKYSKNFPEIFAIFSIIEQEQNSKIFDVQSHNFDLINSNILRSDKASSGEILNALRGLFHNNNITKSSSKIKQKIAKFLFEQAKKIINQKNDYNDCLVRVLLFEFPFLISKSSHILVNSLIRDNRKGSNKILKEIFLNHDNLGFLNKFDEVVGLINCCITSNNKSIYMVLLKHIRHYKLNNLLFQKSNLDLRKKLLSAQILKAKGPEFGSLFLSFYQDKNLIPADKKIVISYLRSIHDLKKDKEARVAKINDILKYLQLSKAMGYKNKDLFVFASSILGEIKNKKNSAQVEFKDFDENNFLTPRTTITSGTTLNIAKLSPEEYWLMNHSGYLA